MEVTINKQAKCGWDGPGFYVVHDDPDHDGWLFYLTHKNSDGDAYGVCIVEANGFPGTHLGEINVVGMRKLQPGETITIEP